MSTITPLPKPRREDRKRSVMETSELPQPKAGYLRDAEYRAWVRTHRCLLAPAVDGRKCERFGDRQRVEAAHLVHGAGMGIKGSDASCVPLCPAHHDGYDAETLPWQIVAFLWMQALFLREEWHKRGAS